MSFSNLMTGSWDSELSNCRCLQRRWIPGWTYQHVKAATYCTCTSSLLLRFTSTDSEWLYKPQEFCFAFAYSCITCMSFAYLCITCRFCCTPPVSPVCLLHPPIHITCMPVVILQLDLPTCHLLFVFRSTEWIHVYTPVVVNIFPLTWTGKLYNERIHHAQLYEATTPSMVAQVPCPSPQM